MTAPLLIVCQAGDRHDGDAVAGLVVGDLGRPHRRKRLSPASRGHVVRGHAELCCNFGGLPISWDDASRTFGFRSVQVAAI
jgi:hypothetical protein